MVVIKLAIEISGNSVYFLLQFRNCSIGLLHIPKIRRLILHSTTTETGLQARRFINIHQQKPPIAYTYARLLKHGY